MNERPQAEEQDEPKNGRDPLAYPQSRTREEMGTHQGGKNRPPHRADALHGDIPQDLPPGFQEE